MQIVNEKAKDLHGCRRQSLMVVALGSFMNGLEKFLEAITGRGGQRFLDSRCLAIGR